MSKKFRNQKTIFSRFFFVQDFLVHHWFLSLLRQIFVVEVANGKSSFLAFGCDVFLNRTSFVFIDFQSFRIDWELRLGFVGKLEVEGIAQNGFRIEFIHCGLAFQFFIWLNFRPALNRPSIFRKYLVFLFLQFFCSFQFRFIQTFLLSPLPFQLLQSSDFQLVQVILLPQDLEILLGFDDQLVFKFLKFLLQFSSLFLLFGPEINSLMVCLFLHQVIHSLFFFDFQLTQFPSKVQCFVHSFLKGNQFFLKLQFFQSVCGLDLYVFIWVVQLLFQILCLVVGLFLEILSPIEFGLLQVFIILIKLVAKLIDGIFAFLPVLLDLTTMDFGTKNLLPFGNQGFQGANFFHQVLKPNILLNLKAIIGNQFQPFLDERKYLDLLIHIEASIPVLIKDPHELPEGGCFGVQ